MYFLCTPYSSHISLTRLYVVYFAKPFLSNIFCAVVQQKVNNKARSIYCIK